MTLASILHRIGTVASFSACALVGALLLTLAAPARSAELALTINGVDDALAAAARTGSGIDDLDCDAAVWALGFRLGRLEGVLRDGLRARGHHAPSFERRRKRVDDCWALDMQVDAGPLTRLREVKLEVQGPGAADFADLLAAHPMLPGAVLDESRYEALKQGLHERAMTLGYLEARLAEHRIDVYTEEALADVVLGFDTGPRHHFDQLDIVVAPDRLDPELIARLAQWRPGTPYSLEAVGNLRRRLQGSGYIEAVDLHTRVVGSNRVDLDARVQLRPRHSVGGGVGYATDIGPRAELGYENRYLNRSGHQGSVDLRGSLVFTTLRGEYRLPLEGAGDPWLVLDTARTRERTDTVSSDAVSAAIRRVHAGPWDSRLTEFLEVSRERFEVATDDEQARLVVAGISIDRSRRIALEPLELGWHTRFDIRGTASPLSTTDFLQARLDAELALPLGARSRLIIRGIGGATLTPSIGQLPSSVRFFAGGDRSIRGYGLDDIGPLDLNGEVRGGRHLIVTSLELEQMVRGRWSAAVFADTGAAFNDADDANDTWSTGVGVGVRWRSPLGPIRVDLAVPLDDPRRELRLHFGIGNLFQ